MGAPEGPQPKTERITDVLAAKEKEIQGATGDTSDIVRQEDVDAKAKALQQKIKDSPIDDKRKDEVKKALDSLQKGHVDLVEGIKNKNKKELEQAFERIKKDLDNFTKEGKVGEIFNNVEPFFEEKQKIAEIIGLKTYGKGSGYWREINRRLTSLADIDETKVRYIQKNILNVDEDGKVGPKTMNAMGKLLGLRINVTYGRKTVQNDGKEVKWEKPKDAPADTSLPGEKDAKVEAPTNTGAPQHAKPETAQKTQPTGPAEAATPQGSPPPLLDQQRRQTATLDATTVPQERPPGFARLEQEGEGQKIFRGFSDQQKGAMLNEFLKQNELTEAQKLRIQQVSMAKKMLESLTSMIRDKRTWGETLDQKLERGVTTGRRVIALERMEADVDQAALKILKNPNIKLTDLLQKETLGMLHDRGASIILIDPVSQETVKTQYLRLIELLRRWKDYDTAQHLIEDTLLGPDFQRDRDVFPEAEKQRIRDEATHKVNTRITPQVLKQWRAPRYKDGDWASPNMETIPGMTEEQIQVMREAMIDTETKRDMNKKIAEYNNGRPFKELQGQDKQIMEVYRDIMGTGDWHNLSDKTWDTVIEEIIINAPLIIASGGIASAARGALSIGARAVLTTGRFAKIGLTVARGAEGTMAVVRGGKMAEGFYWAGRGVGMLAEGAAFETAHMGLQGEWIGNQPNWVKQIIWSSATLGTFHASGKLSEKFLNSGLLTKFADESLAKGIQKLAVSGATETATMLAVGAAQKAVETGKLSGPDLDEVLHALLSVGALKISGGIIEVAGKKFKPEKPIEKAGEEAAKPIEMKPPEYISAASEGIKLQEGATVRVADASGNGKFEEGWTVKSIDGEKVKIARKTNTGEEIKFVERKRIFTEKPAEQKAEKPAEQTKKPPVKGDKITIPEPNGTPKEWRVTGVSKNGEVFLVYEEGGKVTGSRTVMLADIQKGGWETKPAEKAAEKPVDPVDNAEKQESGPNWRERTRVKIKEWIDKIPDIQLRQKVSSIAKDLFAWSKDVFGKGRDKSKARLESIRKQWDAIKESVKKTSKEVYEMIESAFKREESGEKPEKPAEDQGSKGNKDETADKKAESRQERKANAEPQYRTEADLNRFIDGLPETVAGSREQYPKARIRELIREVLSGGRSLNYLTGSNGIHEAVRGYMEGVVKKSERKFKLDKNPFTGEPLNTLEAKFRHAQFMEKVEGMPHGIKEKMLRYDKLSPEERQEVLTSIFAKNGDVVASTEGNANYMYFNTRELSQNRKAQKHTSDEINRHLGKIEALGYEYEAAKQRGDQVGMQRAKEAARKIMEEHGELMARERKIHVHPKMSAQPLFIERITNAIANDPILREHIAAVKFAFRGEQRNGENAPDIVI